jgi:hypothetical protein
MNSLTAPAAERAHSVTISSDNPAHCLHQFQWVLPGLLPAGPQNLETAQALAQLAAQCLTLLEQRLPVFNYQCSEFCHDSLWVTEAIKLENNHGLHIYEGKWHADPFGHLHKVSAPVYELARDLEALADQSELQRLNQLDSKQSPEVIAAQTQALAQGVV